MSVADIDSKRFSIRRFARFNHNYRRQNLIWPKTCARICANHAYLLQINGIFELCAAIRCVELLDWEVGMASTVVAVMLARD